MHTVDVDLGWVGRRLGNGSWPIMPPPERNEEEQAMHARAVEAEAEALEQQQTVPAQSSKL